MGGGYEGTTVATSWEGSAAWLDVEGAVRDGEMARRMALLAVNQASVRSHNRAYRIFGGVWLGLAAAATRGYWCLCLSCAVALLPSWCVLVASQPGAQALALYFCRPLLSLIALQA